MSRVENAAIRAGHAGFEFGPAERQCIKSLLIARFGPTNLHHEDGRFGAAPDDRTGAGKLTNRPSPQADDRNLGANGAKVEVTHHEMTRLEIHTAMPLR